MSQSESTPTVPAAPEALQNAVHYVRKQTDRSARVAIILGSGLGDGLADTDVVCRIPYADIPGLPAPTVAGHGGALELRDIGGKLAWILAGRIHGYEGHARDTVLLPARLVAELGAEVMIATNAVGAIRTDLVPGDLVLITDHLNLMGFNPLASRDAREYGEVFLPLNTLYDVELRSIARTVAESVDVTLGEAIYTAFSGPTYETPAEVRMAASFGGDVAGMSLVPEAIACAQRGVRVLAISCITNPAAGTSDTPPSHEEVLVAGREAAARMGRLLKGLVEKLGDDR